MVLEEVNQVGISVLDGPHYLISHLRIPNLGFLTPKFKVETMNPFKV